VALQPTSGDRGVMMLTHVVSSSQESPIHQSPRVGDRVRVCLADGVECDECPHFVGEVGRIGRVVRDRPITSAPSHPYLVIYEPSHISEALCGWAAVLPVRHFAAEELELID
jgi:hypothetical protein